MIVSVIILLFSICTQITSRRLIEITNSNNTLHETDEQTLDFNKSFFSTHRLILAKLILLCILGCFFWICSCQLIIRQIYADKQRSQTSVNTQGNISTIPIK